MKPEAMPEATFSVPDDLPEDVKQEILALFKDSELRPGPFAIDESFIRHWCETLEDGNPLYLDEEFARSRGLGGLMAPPVSIFPAAYPPFRWPWPPKEGSSEMILFRLKRLLKLPIGIATECEMRFFGTVEIGERISSSSRLVSFSPRKKTRLGEGHFVTYAYSYWNERKEKVAEQSMVVFIYGEASSAEEEAAMKGGYSNSIEEAIEGDKTAYRPEPPKKLFWEDVEVGDELPSIRMPVNMTRCVFMASATRDFSPHHSNPEYARNRSKTRDVIVNTQFNMGMVSRLATDWAGPSATVRRVRIKMKDNVCPGDEMIVTGRVLRKYEKDGEYRVDIDVMISNQERPVTPCEASVALPRRTA